MPEEMKIIRNPITEVRNERDRALPNMKLKYELLTQLTRKTILGKIVSKFIQTAIPIFFDLAIEDDEGNRLPDIEKECKPLNELLNRRLFGDMIKQYLVYGTSFLYIGNINKGQGELGEVFLLNPWDLQQKVENGVLIGWDYQQNNAGFSTQKIFIPYEDVVVMAHDADINELYGYSIAEPMAEFLTYFLNANFDMATIMDGFAVPLLLWVVETDESDLASDVMINKVRDMLYQQLQAGDDIVLDKKIEAMVVNFGKDATKLVEFAREVRKNFGMTSIPESILGGEAPNLNAIKIQLQMFYLDSNYYQAHLNDIIVDRIYKPFLESKGFNMGQEFSNVYINFPLNVLESNSEKAIWLESAIKSGAIDVNLYRLTLGIRGKPPAIEDVEAYLESTGRLNKNEPRGDEPHIRDGRDPDADSENNAENTLDKLMEEYTAEELIQYIQDN